MTTDKNLLIELFVEELPPKSLNTLGEAFRERLFNALHRFGFVDRAITSSLAFASPRRLAVHIPGVPQRAAEQRLSQKLMPASVGLNAAGEATPALLKKLAALGADASVVPGLKRALDGKAEALFYDSVVPGVSLQQGLQKALDEAIAKLPIPKVMSYQLETGVALPGWDSVSFVRPAHGLVALHGADVVAVTALGLTAGRATTGHRFEAALKSITLRDADSYEAQLESEGAVIASFAKRRAEIVRQLALRAPVGTKAIDDDALLDEVTALVERPNVLLCEFEKEFLAVPQECLILTMKANQKYFPLLDAAAKLTHQFLIVSNISPADPSAVISGNEKVVRPRLADAKFFFDQDRKRTLESRVGGLSKVVYHGQLGTLAERMERVRAIAKTIAAQVGDAALVAQADLAARLAKADLLTDMVGEFPELQGIMGGYYARHDGLGEPIACAIEDHYKPRFAGDSLPRNQAGMVVALADKLETLVGLFGIGQVPSGDKDPFALRRHALGVLRMLAEGNVRIPLKELIRFAVQAFPDSIQNKTFDTGGLSVPLKVKLIFFFNDRSFAYLKDQGFTQQECDAVVHLSEPSDYAPRLRAIRDARALFPLEFAALANADKRARNIINKSGALHLGIYDTDIAILVDSQEKVLLEITRELRKKVNDQVGRGDFSSAMLLTVQVSKAVTDFFDSVMVNAEDQKLRTQRFNLLHEVTGLTNCVANLSRLAT